MELSERYIAQLEKEGFTNIYEWQDKPGAVYPEHTHQGKVTLCLTDGAITFTIAGQTHKLIAPTVFVVPPHTPHSAIVGPKGAIYIVGEDIPGDS